MKLWQKNITSLKEVEKFTVGNDREFDLLLAPFDVLGNIAHAKMLATVGLLTNDEAAQLATELKAIYKTTQQDKNAPSGDGGFTIHDNIEDVHSQIEFLLTEKLGDIGKKKYILPAAVTTRCWLISNCFYATNWNNSF